MRNSLQVQRKTITNSTLDKQKQILLMWCFYDEQLPLIIFLIFDPGAASDGLADLSQYLHASLDMQAYGRCSEREVAQI